MPQINLKHIARLARLHFEEIELKVFESKIADILKFAEQLSRVDVAGIEPTSHPLAVNNVFRDDVIIPPAPIERFLGSAPSVRGRFFEVPKIIEDPS